MSSRNNLSVIATVIVGVIIVVGFAGYTYHITSSSFSSISEQNANLQNGMAGLSQQNAILTQQVSSLTQQVASQNQQLSVQDQQLSSQGEQVSNLEQQVSTLVQRTLTVVTLTNTVVTVETTTSVVTSTVTSITAVPQTTLVVTGDSYDNATDTFTFQVQNTQNYTVYAQLGASFYGAACQFYAGEGSYASQVYTFVSNSNTTVRLDLKSVTFYTSSYCGREPIAYFTMSFSTPSAAVSPTYTFYVVPGYQF